MKPTAYFNGKFVPLQDIRLSPDDRGFLFADGAYEVIRSYEGRLFRLDEHFSRLARSLRELKIIGTDVKKLYDVSHRLIQENHLDQGHAKVYIQITRGPAPRMHAFPENAVPTEYACAAAFEPSHKAWKDGIRVILVPDIRWARCDIKTVSLLPNVMAFQQALDAGAGEAVFVRDGAVTEGTHTNFCAVFDGVLLTYPESHYILSGITRKVVFELCQNLNIPIREFPVFEKNLEKADECMLFGTTMEVTPVIRINDHIVGNGTPGPITIKLQKAFQSLVGNS